MYFSIKNILPFWILFFTCFSLQGAETVGENPCPIKYHFYEKEDCIKVKIVLPIGIMPQSTLCKINKPNLKGAAVRIKNDQLKRLETFYQLVDIEIYAIPSQEEGGVKFEIIENLERKTTDRNILADKITNSSKYFVRTDKQVDFRGNILPKLTVSGNSLHIKYVRFFTKS